MILTAHLIFFVIPDGHSTISAANDIKTNYRADTRPIFFCPVYKNVKNYIICGTEILFRLQTFFKILCSTEERVIKI